MNHSAKESSHVLQKIGIGAGILLVAFNLRAGITSVSSVLSPIGQALHLSSTSKGVLVTLPVLCLGLSAPLAPWLIKKMGSNRAVLMLLGVLSAALALRVYTATIGLFAGTIVACGAMGVMGILLPGIIKRAFPKNASLVIGIYTAVLSLSAAAGAGASEPMRQAFGNSWRYALAFWALPVILATVVWFPQVRGKKVNTARKGSMRRLLRDGVAWQVTAYLTLQAALAYTIMGWLPTILAHRGMSPVAAGLALSTSLMIQVGSAIAAPWIAGKMRDQRVVILAVVMLIMAGFAGCLYAPSATLWGWVVVMGIGQGGMFAMALSLLSLRAPDDESADNLSAMAQGIGYTLASLGPFSVGLVHDIFHSWAMTGILLGVLGVLTAIAGLAAGRNQFVNADAADG